MGSDYPQWNTKLLGRAGVIAELYTVIAGALGSFSSGPCQIRPAEAFTILPLFFPETIPALYVGCILATLISLYLYDVFLGSLATLFAAIFTFFPGKLIKNHILRVAIGGFFPVILNAFIVPAVWILAQTPDEVYSYSFGSMVLTQSVWVYAIGIPLYIAVLKLRQRGVSVFTSPVHAVAKPVNSSEENKGAAHEKAENGGVIK